MANSPVNGGVDPARRNLGPVSPMFKPNELLQLYDEDLAMLRPLMIYNLENIQNCRADCRYKRSKHWQTNFVYNFFYQKISPKPKLKKKKKQKKKRAKETTHIFTTWWASWRPATHTKLCNQFFIFFYFYSSYIYTKYDQAWCMGMPHHTQHIQHFKLFLFFFKSNWILSLIYYKWHSINSITQFYFFWSFLAKTQKKNFINSLYYFIK